mmetsp:Transcript_22705/g.58068  ORF Transcript_22705/g.58068 Transcript_22705/m.58068 type:complete len:112 (+) Transcript_22705:519-854(+)
MNPPFGSSGVLMPRSVSGQIAVSEIAVENLGSSCRDLWDGQRRLPGDGLSGGCSRGCTALRFCARWHDWKTEFRRTTVDSKILIRETAEQKIGYFCGGYDRSVCSSSWCGG